MPKNLATEAAQTAVVFSTCHDPAHPADCVIDGSETTFWSTTGLFPQELVISFESAVTVSSIETRTMNVRGMTLMKSMQKSPTDFNLMCKSELENGEGMVQTHQHEMSETVCRHLKIVLSSGWDNFAAVFEVQALGEVNSDMSGAR